ncbi:MAG: MarR family transcriptional regulator [Deltaproteobacteria bacterium]|nr:MarR family transcriptional regulator [Deltaproteobacteria bacterium]
MATDKQLEDLAEIEMHLIEIRNLFSGLFQHMAMHSKGLMGFPVNSSQLKAMAAFHEERQYSMGELCKIANVKMPSMTEVVDRLEAAGFAERVRDTDDRRVVKVQLTAAGKKAHDGILKTRAQELQNIFGCLEEKERQRLVKALRTVSSTMKRVAEKHTGAGEC